MFKPLGSIAYDLRILSWRLDKNEISIWTIDGRQAIPFVYRERDKELLAQGHPANVASLICV
jgi:hypothetical protein